MGLTIKELAGELSDIRRRNHKLRDDSAFVCWFLQAYLTDSEEAAKKALTGETGDKSIDAVFIDDKAKQANIIQGKFRSSEKYNEKRNDVLALADLGLLPWEDRAALDTFYSKLDPLVKQKFEELVQRVKNDNYSLKLFYITTGRVSKTIINEAEQRAREAEGTVSCVVFDYEQVMVLFKDYLIYAPATHTLALRITTEGTIQHEGVIHRFDPERKTESWVFTMAGDEVGRMFAQEGPRLFARNIRGYLGDTEINKSMKETVEKEPHNFWYYNNGVTMVCNDAKRETKGGEDILLVERGQVINGQQTTRTLHNSDARATNVLVKVIKIPRVPGDDEQYDDLVNSIVRATNWQNYIAPSDLVSNDYIQVFLEKEFRKRGYQYIRKRMKKSEAKTLFENQTFYQIDKRELAQAVGACLFDPAVVRKGKEGLFEDPYYKSIFGSHTVSFYLSKYWLMKAVQNAAWGYPERAYAKWVVLNFLWSLFGKELETGDFEKRFRQCCEEKSDILGHLHKATDDVFRAALKFYRKNRGKGEKAKDVSAFFQLTKLHVKFQQFWHSNANPYKTKVERNLKKFIESLETMEIVY
ncbi:MAG: AIPR family protein [Candidatus Bathyarchaeota archaeon]|nr:AIPR family protein [Candidatus Bathyarchaeota archaeon]